MAFLGIFYWRFLIEASLESYGSQSVRVGELFPMPKEISSLVHYPIRHFEPPPLAQILSGAQQFANRTVRGAA